MSTSGTYVSFGEILIYSVHNLILIKMHLL